MVKLFAYVAQPGRGQRSTRRHPTHGAKHLAAPTPCALHGVKTCNLGFDKDGEKLSGTGKGKPHELASWIASTKWI
ncbi:hypothetical protein CRENBAI_012045 [Crenichthys baileyi]|uniref:Uncharacterized protein n=1 Tax=Crenichthys baileyi TaxID=28760 RepID=A0AAV9QV47_9TELE